MMHFLTKLNLLFAGFLLCTTAGAREIYQQPNVFLNETFNGNPPESKVVWLTRSIRPVVEDILAHKAHSLRIRYWKQGSRSAWVLEEIGKEKPITAGFVINKGKIERVKILIFRESRGWEIRHSFFTKQFQGAHLTNDRQLDRNIDGISGATLSVRAIRKLSRIALYLDQHTSK